MSKSPVLNLNTSPVLTTLDVSRLAYANRLPPDEASKTPTATTVP